MDPEIYYMNSGDRRYGTAPVHLTQRHYWEFQAVLSGRIAPVTATGAHPLASRRLWIFENRHHHGWTGDGERAAEILVYHLPAPDSVLQRLVKGNGGMLSVPLTRADMNWLRRGHRQLAGDWTRPTELTHLKITRLLAGLTLLALERSGYQARPMARNLDAERVERALYWYRQNLYQHPGVSEVAGAVGMSEVHLRRLFNAVRKESPKQAFQRIRMEQIRAALRDPNLTVEGAAAAFGFADASSLTRAYRQHFGQTPRIKASGG